MRTTLDLPDDLMMAVKKRALEMHQPMRELVESVLRQSLLEYLPKPAKQPKKKIHWATVSGELPDFDISSRAAMYEWIGKSTSHDRF